MPTVVDIRTADDPRDVIHRAVQLLSDGEIVAFPTETVYVLAAHPLKIQAVIQLSSIIGNNKQSRLSLGLKESLEVLDYVPKISNLGKKLIRRCWPGPVTFSFDLLQNSSPPNILSALPAEVRELLIEDGRIAFRVPAHEIVLEILRLMPTPLVLSVESIDDQPIAVTAEEVVEQYGESVSLVIDEGKTRYAQRSTDVHIADEKFEMSRQGVVTQTTLTRLASEVFLFVCTGNTCRSPMAEGLFRNLLAEKLQCLEDDLIDRGFIVASAGLAAAEGAPASPESVELLQKRDIDIRNHESQPLTGRLLDQADYIYTMTQNHYNAIASQRPDLVDRLQTLMRDGSDIPDPIGGGMGEYQKCEAEIDRSIRAILAELEIS